MNRKTLATIAKTITQMRFQLAYQYGRLCALAEFADERGKQVQQQEHDLIRQKLADLGAYQDDGETMKPEVLDWYEVGFESIKADLRYYQALQDEE